MEYMFDSEFYQKVLNQTHINIYITDIETDEIVYINDYMKKTFQLDDKKEKICWKVLQKDKTKRCEFCKIDQLVKSRDKKVYVWEQKNAVTGRTYINYDSIESWNGRIYHIQNSIDITDKIQLSKEVSIDELTGVWSRNAGKRRLDEILRQMGNDDKFTVALYDINGLKWVNDTYGHLEGDRLLQFVAQNIKKELEEGDFIFRLSGDEFIIVFVDKTVAQADRWMKKILDLLEERSIANGMSYGVAFSYGFASIYAGGNLSVSDVLSIADTQMYIQKRNYHIMKGRKRFQEQKTRMVEIPPFQYNKDYLFEALSESIDGYMFVGNLKTGEFMYSHKMVVDFGLPGQIVSNAAAFWGERIHPDDEMMFLRSNQEIADGRAERHTIAYRAKNTDGVWVHLLCKGKMIRNEWGNPDLFAGVIQNLDRGNKSEESGGSLASSKKSDLELFINSMIYTEYYMGKRKATEKKEKFAQSDRNKVFYFAEKMQEENKSHIKEQLLDFLNQYIPGGILAVYDEPGFPLLCLDHAVLEYTQYTFEEFYETTGGDFGRLIYPDDQKMVEEEIAGQLQAKEIYEIRYRILCNGGSVIWAYEKGKYITADDGRRMILSFFVEISHEVQNEQEMRFIKKNSMDGIFKASITESFPLIYANEKYYKIHGYTKEQMGDERNNLAMLLVYEPDRKDVQKQIEKWLQDKEDEIVLEYRIKKRDGRIAWVHADAEITTLPDGSFAMLGMVRDITKQRELEECLRRTEQLFAIAKKHTRLKLWEYDVKNNRIIQKNDSQEFQGYGKVIENIPESLIEEGYIHPESISAIRKMYKRVREGEKEVSAVVQVRGKDSRDKYWWEKITYTSAQSENGRTIWAVGASEDVTAQKEAEIGAFKEEMMREMLEGDLLFSFRINIRRNYLEEVWECSQQKMKEGLHDLGYPEIFKKIKETIANEDDCKRFQAYTLDKIYEYAQTMYPIPDFEFRQKQKDGMILWVMLNMRIMRSPNGEEPILFGYARNIDLQKKRELALQKKVEIDEVSGFYSHATAKLLVQNILKNEKENKGVSALMLLDVDNFNKVNRTGGYLAGNTILRQMSQEIRSRIPASCISARHNGDVFSVFFYNMKSDQEIYRLAMEIRSALCRRYTIKQYEIHLTVSAGMVYRFSDDMTYDQMYQCALHSLDTAKRNGKNMMLFYREIENLDSGMEIEFMVEMKDYNIIYMNVTGQIALGMKGTMKTNLKCYELLYNRKKPCPFCNARVHFEKACAWECFIPRFNKLMYVQERLALKEGEIVREIRLRERSFDGNRGSEDENLYIFMEECYSNIEKGEDLQSVLRSCMAYVGKFYHARCVLFLTKEEEKELKETMVWRMDSLSADDGLEKKRENGWLEKVLELAMPENSILIDTEESPGYPQLQNYYGKGSVPGAVLLTKIMKQERRTGCLMLEDVCCNKNTMKTLEAVAAAIHHIQSVFELKKNYENAVCRDQKTGLFNYNRFRQKKENLDVEVCSALGMVGVHIVDLKRYNQKYGVRRGDELVIFASEQMAKIFGKDSCYRISGASFLGICPDMTYENFLHRCERLEKEIKQLYPKWIVIQKVWEQHAISVERLQRQIEEKLMVAVNKKRNQDYSSKDKTMLEMTRGLKNSIGNGRFCTFLQPKATAKEKEICGAEALVRYAHKEKGIISPGRFLPEIERAGLIRYVDLFVLEDVCRMIRKWMDAGWKPFPISLNFSRTTILEPGILAETNRITECFDIPKELIEIEVTETISSIDNASLQDIVNQFITEGYKIALDDFGSEYSNIYVLYSLNLTSLKLDRRIVSDIYHDSKARMVVENIIDLCKKLDIICVAEGVETEEQLDILRTMNCNTIQGYYLNKPLPERDFEAHYIKCPVL
ncbi:MAG: diguanylate cyclase [Eubacteriales bacterium]|nr:diguanylate cyclase [Eubacteriales bacterium]